MGVYKHEQKAPGVVEVLTSRTEWPCLLTVR